MSRAELSALKALSATLGSNPLLVQAAGGNTSLKSKDIMWIKASGTWLNDAATKDIFVPLDLTRLLKALGENDPACESCTDFVRQDINPLGLRPSIETSVHGLMPQAVVLHVHCVNTIAWAIQENAEVLLAPIMANFNWGFVPYARPGLELSRAIGKALKPITDVLILENHGLVVAAATTVEAGLLLDKVIGVLKRTVIPTKAPDLRKLARIADGTDYRLPADKNCHGFATDKSVCKIAARHAYYPDHVVFLGPEIPSDFSLDVPAIAIPGAGVLVHKNAKPAVEPMLRCLSDVFARLAPTTKLNALTSAEIGALLNWDAEKYRQSLKIE